MDAKYYCDSMQDELTATRARIYTIIREMEQLTMDDKAAAEASITEMNHLVDDINTRLARLRVECPADWRPEREKIESMKKVLSEKIDLWDKEHIAGGYVGG